MTEEYRENGGKGEKAMVFNGESSKKLRALPAHDILWRLVRATLERCVLLQMEKGQVYLQTN